MSKEEIVGTGRIWPHALDVDVNIPKVAIVGSGHIGPPALAAALRMFPRDKPCNIVFYGRDKEKTTGEFMDYGDGADIDRPFSERKSSDKSDNIKVTISDDMERDLIGCDVIIYTIGVSAAQLGTKHREAALPFVYKAIRNHAKIIKKSAPNALILMITNPVDIATWMMKEETGFSSDKVLGSGTELDARRFRKALKKELRQKGITITTVDAEVGGGHSEKEMVVFEDSTKLDDLSIDEFCQVRNVDRGLLNTAIGKAKAVMRTEGFDIIKKKGWGASYVPALLLVEMARNYLFGDELRLSAAKFLDPSKENYYGISGCVLSIPLIIRKKEITIDNSIKLLPSEIEELNQIALNHINLFHQMKAVPTELLDKLVKAFNDTLKTKSKYDQALKGLIEPREMVFRNRDLYLANTVEKDIIGIRLKNTDHPKEVQTFLLQSICASLNNMLPEPEKESLKFNGQDIVLLPKNDVVVKLISDFGIELEETPTTSPSSSKSVTPINMKPKLPSKL